MIFYFNIINIPKVHLPSKAIIFYSTKQFVDDESKLLEVNAKLPNFDITFRYLQMVRDYEKDANT